MVVDPEDMRMPELVSFPGGIILPQAEASAGGIPRRSTAYTELVRSTDVYVE